MKNLLCSLIAFSCATYAHSQTLSWSGFPAGGTSYATGIMTATVTSSSPGFQNGAPKYYAGATVGSGQCGIAGGLALEHMFGNITGAHSTLTMDYTSGNTTSGLCGNISFQVKDINADESYQTFADWVEVSAIDGNNNPIPVANITATGGSNKTITTSGNTRIVKGHSNNSYGSRSATLCDNVTFTVTPPAGATLKSVTLKYHPDYTASPNDYYNFTGPKRPAYQYISISPVTVTATAGPTALSLTATPASCDQNDGTLTIGSVTGGTSPYQFSFNGQGLSSNTNYTGLAGGTYPITVRDNNGCTYSTSALITMATGPTAIATTPSDAGCTAGNGSVTLGAVTGGTSPYEYDFNNGGWSTTTGYVNLSAGTYPLVVRDYNGCAYNTTVTIGTVAGPTAIATTPSNAACGQPNGSVAVGAVTGGTSPYEYNFNNGGWSTTTGYANLSAGNYPLVVRDNNGCMYNTTVTIGTTAGPTAIASTSANASCGQANGSVLISSVTGGTQPYQYDFNGGGLSSATGYSNLAPGTYTLMVHDVNGCTYTTTVSVGSSTGPVSIVTTPVGATCGQSNGSLSLGSVTGGTSPYQYDFNNGGLSATTTYANLAAGNYILIVRDANGCTHNTSVTISNTGSDPTSIDYTSTQAGCGLANGSVTLGNTTGGNAPYGYSFNGGSFTSAVTFPNLAAGTYPLVVEDVNGCTYTTSVSVTSASGPAAVATNVLNDACAQGIGSVTIGTVTGGTAPYQYDFNGQGFSSAGNYSGLPAGTYTLVVKDASECTFSTTITITGTAGPSAISSNMSTETCNGSNGTVTLGTVTGGTAPYQYNFNNQGFSTQVSYTGLSAGNYPLTVKDAAGCEYNTTILVSNLSSGPDDVDYLASPAVCGSGGIIQVTGVSGGVGPYTFTYDGTATGPVITGVGSGNHALTVKDANGCLLHVQLIMPEGTGEEYLHIPNVFTPDGDAANATWFIGGSCLQKLECVIVNRWGEPMATFDEITDHWDGTTRGIKAAPGVYFYKVTVTFWSGKTETYHGHITLIY